MIISSYISISDIAIKNSEEQAVKCNLPKRHKRGQSIIRVQVNGLVKCYQFILSQCKHVLTTKFYFNGQDIIPFQVYLLYGDLYDEYLSLHLRCEVYGAATSVCVETN